MDALSFCFTIDADWIPGSQVGLVRLYEFCERLQLKPSVFAAGRFAEAYPDLVREAHVKRFDVGTHGWEHGQDPAEDFRSGTYDQQRRWMQLATEAVEKASGIRPTAFRAPNLSVGETTFRVLRELDYRLDSSVPARRFDFGYGQVRNPRYFRAPLAPYYPSPHNLADEGDSPILEVPPSAFFLPLNMSSMRVLGLPAVKWAVRRIAKRTSILVLYVHPVEFEVAEAQSIPASTPARFHSGLGPQNLDLVERFAEYVQSLGYRPALLSQVAATHSPIAQAGSDTA